MSAKRRINRRSKFALLAAGPLLIVGLVAIGLHANRDRFIKCTPISGKSVLSIDVARLLPNTGRIYCYDGGAGRRIRFILARDKKGVIHSVFDACEECYRHHMGYKIENGELVCRYCGHRYPLGHMNSGVASCVPIHLHHDTSASGTRVEISIKNLKAKRYLFQ